jgi:acetolactate synthase I/III small subunit
MESELRRHTFSALVANKPGVLARVVNLFSRRGFNIESLAVSPTQDPTLSRITLVVEGDDRFLDQVRKQLSKLIDVVRVSDLTSMETVDRELALIKINASPVQRQEILAIANIFRAQVVDVGENSVIIEITGQQEKLSAITNLLKRYKILEIVSTGKVVLVRGEKST